MSRSLVYLVGGTLLAGGLWWAADAAGKSYKKPVNNPQEVTEPYLDKNFHKLPIRKAVKPKVKPTENATLKRTPKPEPKLHVVTEFKTHYKNPGIKTYAPGDFTKDKSYCGKRDGRPVFSDNCKDFLKDRVRTLNNANPLEICVIKGRTVLTDSCARVRKERK